MKNVSLTIAIGLAGFLEMMAQPVFEHIYSESATLCRLESLGEVYYSMDVVNRNCLVYSPDHTLLKSIPLPIPEGYYLADIRHVSEGLFNYDGLVELVYIYSKYVPTETSYYYTFEARLINENGSVLLSLPGVGYTEVIETSDHGIKFLAYEYNYSVIPYRTYTHVYSLPEKTTESVGLTIDGSEGYPYPNPAGGQVHIPVSLPDNVDEATLEVLDLNGRVLLRRPVNENQGHVILSTRLMVPGSYLYQVHAGGVQSSSGKFVVR
jgi:hypothetical protein